MGKPYLIVDAHEDMAWNMLCFSRDYTRPVAETRQLETKNSTPSLNGDTLLGWDEYQAGNVALVFSTLFAAPERSKVGVWDKLCYADKEEAHRTYRDQLDAYHRLVNDHPDKFTLIQSQPDLQALLANWQQAEKTNKPPVGLLILMENAEGVRNPAELAEWWEMGVRIIGPAWVGTRFCGGTSEPGPLTTEGYQLLDGMADLSFTLDISHMDEQAVLQSLDHYPGRIIASHANAQALLSRDSNRFLPDRVIAGLLERDGVVGIVPYNSFLDTDWKSGNPRRQVGLDKIVAQIDYICQMAGDARHVGIGSDFDGGFGLQSVPQEFDSVADLQKLAPLLAEKGYSENDIAAVLGGNWLRLLTETLPE